MPLPGDLTTITVTANYPGGDGTALTGQVTFTPSTDLVDTTGQVIIRAAPVTEQLVAGRLSVVLLCTDNASISPSGWYWIVTEQLAGAPNRIYNVFIPHSGTSVDLSTLAPVIPGPAVSTLYGVLAAPNTNDWQSGQVFHAGVKITTNPAAGDVLTSDAAGNATWQAPAGGGSTTFSRQILIDLSASQHSTITATVGTWTPTYYLNTDTGGAFQGWVSQDHPAAQNDTTSYDFACGAGTYTLELLHLVSTNRGIYTVKVDAATVGTIDGYAAAFAYVRSSLTGIVLTAGQHVLTFTMATKNASSSGYDALIERVILTRTG